MGKDEGERRRVVIVSIVSLRVGNVLSLITWLVK